MVARSPATVTLSQIAELAGTGASAVSNWRRRFEDFPEPAEVSAGGRDLFSLEAVEAWLAANGRLDPERSKERLFFEAANMIREAIPTAQYVDIIGAAIALSSLPGDTAGHHGEPCVLDIVRAVELSDPSLSGVFDPLVALEPAVAQQILELVSRIDPDERVGVFEWVLGRRGRFDDLASSDRLTSLVVQLAQGTSQIFDPAAGEGGFIVAAAEAATGNPALYGQEINPAAWRIAKQRFLLRGLDVELQLGDSLLDDAFSGLRVDVVLCDAPYNSKNPLSAGALTEGHWSPAAVHARLADFVWLQHAIGHLTERGRAHVLLPMGSLTRGGREGDLRTEMIRRGEVEAIVSLPSGSATQTSIGLALWIVRRARPVGEADPVLLVDAAGGDVSSGRAILDGELIGRIVDSVGHWRETRELNEDDRDFAAVVSILDLLGTSSNLLPSRWVQRDSVVDAAQRRRELTAAIDRFVTVRNQLAACSPVLSPVGGTESVRWISVRDLVAGDGGEILRAIRAKPEDETPRGVRVLRTRDLRDEILDDDPRYVDVKQMKRPPRLTEQGDIVISPASGKLRAIVDEHGGHVLAFPLEGLRVRGGWLDPHVAAAFLEGPRNRRFLTGVGSGYARVNLRDLELPVLPLEEASRLRRMLEELQEAARDAHALAGAAQDVRRTLLEFAGGNPDQEDR